MGAYVDVVALEAACLAEIKLLEKMLTMNSDTNGDIDN